ncbi:PH domain-containing protein [Spirillospora albida]|uniref:PH domain-containing protein n=1 Tax=Spirillospora albida TaxID=58123 RepID=UPI0012FC2284|nr:PH domain-containing protein [Spirillospora albida]
MTEMPVRRWGVRRRDLVAKIAAAVVAAALMLAPAHDPQRFLLALGAVSGLLVLILRDLLAPVRLAADEAGVTVVRGFAGRRRVPWAEVTAIRVDERRRLGIRTRLLEIETEDDLCLLSAADLGSDVQDVADSLYRIRA